MKPCQKIFESIYNRKVRGYIPIFMFIVIPAIDYFVPEIKLYNKYTGLALLLYFILLFIYFELSLYRFSKFETLYIEKNASGYSHLNFFTRLGGGNGCLKIRLTKKYLIISSWFPFSLIAPIFDGVHFIRLKNIESIIKKKSWFSTKYHLVFRDRFGKKSNFSLHPKNVKQFEKAFNYYIKYF